MGEVLVGTCSWTDKTLLASGWYPEDVTSAEDRLQYYARQFPIVEVDSSYYGLPAERSAVLWAERTPPHFTFDVKAFRLLTNHPTPLNSIPKRYREELPEKAMLKPNVYQKDLPPDITDAVWSMFRQALIPLHAAGKLGVVLFQFPPWFIPGRESSDYLMRLKERLPEYQVAVEFRQPTWLNDANRARTLDFLREHGLVYTSVDEPQGTRASVPPIGAATADVAVVRFHGRRVGTWDKRGVGVEERFKYFYPEEELKEWVPKIQELAAETRAVHALMNNCYRDYAVRNAADLASLLHVREA